MRAGIPSWPHRRPPPGDGGLAAFPASSDRRDALPALARGATLAQGPLGQARPLLQDDRRSFGGALCLSSRGLNWSCLPPSCAAVARRYRRGLRLPPFPCTPLSGPFLGDPPPTWKVFPFIFF